MKEPVWLPRELVVALHAKAIDEFGGNHGVRDEGLLESALARPRNLLSYGEPSLFALAAAYCFGLAKNHAFIDGNKRVAFSAIDVFLQLNGYALEADEAEAVVVMQDLAADTLSEADLAKWIGINSGKLMDLNRPSSHHSLAIRRTATTQGPLIGIDFSGDVRQWKVRCTQSNVWIAIGNLRDTDLAIQSLTTVQELSGTTEPFERLSQFLNDIGSGYAAIDAPFSVPHSIATDAEELWRRVQALPTEGRPFARGETLVQALTPALAPRGAKRLRDTEQYWQHQGVNIRSTVWAGQRGGAPFAVACMSLLGRHRGGVWPIRKISAKGCVLLEAFPAGQLFHWGLPHTRYNGPNADAREKRTQILDWLEREQGLKMNQWQRDACVESADALDAVICVYAAKALANESMVTLLGEQSHVEGAIAIHP